MQMHEQAASENQHSGGNENARILLYTYFQYLVSALAMIEESLASSD